MRRHWNLFMWMLFILSVLFALVAAEYPVFGRPHSILVGLSVVMSLATGVAVLVSTGVKALPLACVLIGLLIGHWKWVLWQITFMLWHLQGYKP